MFVTVHHQEWSIKLVEPEPMSGRHGYTLYFLLGLLSVGFEQHAWSLLTHCWLYYCMWPPKGLLMQSSCLSQLPLYPDDNQVLLPIVLYLPKPDLSVLGQ